MNAWRKQQQEKQEANRFKGKTAGTWFDSNGNGYSGFYSIKEGYSQTKPVYLGYNPTNQSNYYSISQTKTPWYQKLLGATAWASTTNSYKPKKGWFSKVKDRSKETIKKRWEGVKNSAFGGGVIKAYQKATNSLKNTWDIIRQGASQSWNNTKKIFPTVTNIVKKTASGIKNIAGGIGGYFKKAVVNAVISHPAVVFGSLGLRWYNEKQEKRKQLLKNLKTKIKNYFVGNPLSEEAKPSAKIAEDVYGDKDVTLPDGVRKITDRNELQKYGLTPEMLRNDKSGFLAGVYINDLTGELTIAYAGTKFTSLRDWVTNFGQAIGFDVEQYREARKIAKIINTKIKNGEINGQKVLFVGHSLGGGLAALSGAITGVKTVTFNAAGVNDKILRNAGVDRKDIKEHNFPNITNHVHRGEILTYVQEDSTIRFLAPDALGDQVKFGSRWEMFIPDQMPALKGIKLVEASKKHSLNIK